MNNHISKIKHGLIIKSPWIEKILCGHKTWEVRGFRTKIRGKIALIKSGSGLIFGTCDIVNVIGPLTFDVFIDSYGKHLINTSICNDSLPYLKTYAWELSNVYKFVHPITYIHPRGAIIWVKL